MTGLLIIVLLIILYFYFEDFILCRIHCMIHKWKRITSYPIIKRSSQHDPVQEIQHIINKEDNYIPQQANFGGLNYGSASNDYDSTPYDYLLTYTDEQLNDEYKNMIYDNSIDM